MPKPLDLRAELELLHERYPATGGTDIFRWSETDESQSGRYAEGRIRSIDGPERGLSDPAGDHFLGQATVSGDDTDHLWRGRLDTDETSYIDGRDAILRVQSEAVLAAGGDPTVLMRAKCRELPLEDGLGWSLVLEEWIGSQFGASWLDRTIGRPFRRAIFPNIDRAFLDETQYIVQKILGENSDLGTTRDGVNAEKGLCPGIYVGNALVVTSGATPPVGVTGDQPLDPPPAPTYTKFGGGGTKQWTYACAVRVVGGGRTTLGASVTIDDLPADGSFTPSNGVTLFLAQYPPDLQAQVAGLDLYVKEGAGDSVSPWRYMDATGQMFNMAVNTPFTGGVGYDDDGDDSHHKDWNPPPTENTALVSVSYMTAGGPGTAKQMGRIVFADSAIHELLALYGSDGGADTTDPQRVRWELGTWDDVIDPSHPLWPDPDPWWDITGDDGVTERFYGIYVDGPRLQHHIDGRVTIAANICGRAENADATGDLIDQAFFIWQHMVCEEFFPNDGRGYLTGPYAGFPLAPDLVELVSGASVQAAQALSALLLGTVKGYIGGFCLTAPITRREWLRRFNRTFTAWSFNTREQLAIGLVNTHADASIGIYLREDVDDVVKVGAPKERKDLVETEASFVCSYDADAKKYRTDPEKITSATSKEAHKAIRERGLYEGFCTHDVATMRCAMNQRLLLFDRAPFHYPVTMGTNGFGVELLAQALLSGHEGLGAEGAVLRPTIPIYHKCRLSAGEVDLTLWDLSRVLARLGTNADLVGGVHTWGDGAETWGDGAEVWG